MASLAPTFPTLSPLSLYAIPAYYVVTLSAHIYAGIFAGKRVDSKKLDNANPRLHNTELYKKTLTPADYAKYERAKAAHQNGCENFPLFVAAAIGGSIAGLSKEELDRFAVVTIVGRVLYNLLYINTERRKMSFLRSLVWVTTTVWSFTTLIRAGLKVAA